MTVSIAKKLTLTVESVLSTAHIADFVESEVCAGGGGGGAGGANCNAVRTIRTRRIADGTITIDADGHAQIVLELAPPEFESPPAT